MMGFTDPIKAVVIGARGGVGAAFVDAIQSAGARNEVWATSTTGEGLPHAASRTAAVDITDEDSIVRLADAIDAAGFVPNLVVNCTGLLHNSDFGPERSWRHLDIDVMRKVFDVNTFGVALLGKHLIPRFDRAPRGVFASLSARVGSIADNRLGGWYSYRASKAAQNMVIKTLSIEASMRWKGLICVALHPGTVDTALSEPFSARVPAHKLFSTELSCSHLSTVIEGLTTADTGGFFAWDGKPIIY